MMGTLPTYMLTLQFSGIPFLFCKVIYSFKSINIFSISRSFQGNVFKFVISHIGSTTSTPSVTLYNNCAIKDYHPKCTDEENELKGVNTLQKGMQLVNMGTRV